MNTYFFPIKKGILQSAIIFLLAYCFIIAEFIQQIYIYITNEVNITVALLMLLIKLTLIITRQFNIHILCVCPFLLE